MTAGPNFGVLNCIKQPESLGPPPAAVSFQRMLTSMTKKRIVHTIPKISAAWIIPTASISMAVLRRMPTCARHLIVFDYKHGKGVEVQAEESARHR